MSIPLVKIVRDTETKDATLGILTVADTSLSLQTLEQLWRGNAHSVSRIPPGTYPMAWIYSAKHERSLWNILSVPGRDCIEVHSGNTQRDTKGCIILGSERMFRADVSYVLASRVALASFEARLLAWQTLGCTIEIIDQFTQQEKRA
jgi:hypothetical protein